MRKIPKYDDAMRKLVSATDVGIQQIRKSSDVTSDYDVALYESLTPIAFDLMAADLGDDVVGNYIMEMEKKRMKAQRGA